MAHFSSGKHELLEQVEQADSGLDLSIQVEEDEVEDQKDVPAPYPDQQCSRTTPVSAKYRVSRMSRMSRKMTEPKVLASTSLSSPISILASPGGLISGPLSCPATFSWGKQSPIPHRGSPGGRHNSPSPFLLSPGQEHFPSTLTSSPLPLLPMGDSVPRMYTLPMAEGRVTPLSLSAEPVPKPAIPVGIAVARQRQTESLSAAQLKEQQPIPWSMSLLSPTPNLAPLLHPALPLPQYLPRESLHGAYLGGGEGAPASYWSPYSSYAYPFLLPSSLSHYQHYQNQLLLLQHAQQGGFYPGMLGAPSSKHGPIYPQYDPFRPLPPLSPKAEDLRSTEEDEEEEVKIISTHNLTRDDSGHGTLEFSQCEAGQLRAPSSQAVPPGQGSQAAPAAKVSLGDSNGRLEVTRHPLEVTRLLLEVTRDGCMDLSKKKEHIVEEDNISVGTESVENCSQDGQPITGPQKTDPIRGQRIVPPITNTSGKTYGSINVKNLNQISQNLPSVIDSSAAQVDDQKNLSGENLPSPMKLKQEPYETGYPQTQTDLKTTRLSLVGHPDRAHQFQPGPTPSGLSVPGICIKSEAVEDDCATVEDDSRLRVGEEVPSGLDLLTEGIERLERGNTRYDPRHKPACRFHLQDAEEGGQGGVPGPSGPLSSSYSSYLNAGPTCLTAAGSPQSRAGRHASVDSHLPGHLGLLCDAVSERLEQEGLAPGSSRINRSRSAETAESPFKYSESPFKEYNIRKVSDPVARQNIREFIQRRSSRSSDGQSPARLSASSPYRAGTSPYRAGSSPYRAGSSPCKSVDLEDMDAWEISVRIDMADIQKKYREKYRELYKLESRKVRRKPKRKRANSFKRSNSDSKNRNRTKAQVPAVKVRANRTSTEDTVSEGSEPQEPGQGLNINNNTSGISPVKEEVVEQHQEQAVSTVFKSTFDETFAKFKKSYLSAKLPPTAEKTCGQNKPPVATVCGSILKVKHDRPSPFENLMKLSCIKTEPVSSHQEDAEEEEEEKEENLATPIKMEPVTVKTDPDIEDLSSKPEVANIFKYKKRLSAEEESTVKHKGDEDASPIKQHKSCDDESLKKRKSGEVESPKKRLKHEKYILAPPPTGEAGSDTYFGPDPRHKERKRSKEKCRKEHKNCKKHKERAHGSSHTVDTKRESFLEEFTEQLGTYNQLRSPTHSFNTELEFCKDSVRKSHKERKKEKKREKEKKKKKRKEKEKKPKRVRVREITEDEYISEIMDRTPTPSSDSASKRVNISPLAECFIKQEVKEEPLDHWQTAQEKIQSSILSESKLRDGQRILTRIGGHFHPGRITEISPPDIYGILVDRERGNKPHIYSREEVLAQAILEVVPRSVAELEPGVRVCAYWSSKYNYLHPGTIVENTQGLNLTPDYLVIELDDGDSRDFHVDSIRYLPPGYPLVVGEADPMSGLGEVRRRRTSSCISRESPKKRKDEKKSSKSVLWKSEVLTPNLKIRIRSPESIKSEDGPPVLKRESPCPLDSGGEREDEECPRLELPGTSTGEGRLREDDEDSAFESNGRNEEEELEEELEPDLQESLRKRMPSSDKSKIRAFFPPQHVLWDWGGEGTKPKNKTRKVFHDEICRGDERIKVGESAVFLSTSRPDRPYIGRIESMWESWSGNMKVRVRWFYHAEETEGTGEGGKRVQDLQHPGALFESCHFDENDIQTISHKCEVVGFTQFLSRLQEAPALKESIYENNDLFYLAGTYDPVVGTLCFKPDVFSRQK